MHKSKRSCLIGLVCAIYRPFINSITANDQFKDSNLSSVYVTSQPLKLIGSLYYIYHVNGDCSKLHIKIPVIHLMYMYKYKDLNIRHFGYKVKIISN